MHSEGARLSTALCEDLRRRMVSGPRPEVAVISTSFQSEALRPYV